MQWWLHSGTTLTEVVWLALKEPLPIADFSFPQLCDAHQNHGGVAAQDQGNKMLLDSALTTHERVVQVGTLEET